MNPIAQQALARARMPASAPTRQTERPLRPHAAPAEDARAVVDEPLPIGTLHRDCDERIVFESSGEIHIKDGMEVFSHPQRPERT